MLNTMLQKADAQRDAGQLEEALATYDAALASAPENLHLLNGRAGVLGQMGLYEDAAIAFDRAITLAPRVAELHYNRATALQRCERWVDALSSFDRALYLRPDYPEALVNRGLVLQALHRPEDALVDYNHAIQLAANYPRALHNRGVTLQELERYVEALADYDQALALEPRYAEAHYNRGGVLGEMERFDEALASFQRATQLSQRYAQAHLNEGLVRLLTGDFARGWPKYEWRDGGTYSGQQSRFAEPQWRASTESAGKSVYLYGEQGLGDTIQFARYVQLVADKGATVMLGVPAQLKALLGGLAGAPQIISENELLPPFDYQRPLLSLPFVFGTTLDTIPAPQSYLSASPELVESWMPRLGEDKSFRIGICWQGSPGSKVDAGRSIPLEEFAALANVPNVRLISLQKQDGLEQLYELPAGMKVETLDDLDSGADAFVDTAAVMAQCDLIVTSDTAIAHLAGALGRPTWVALKRVPDFRWLLSRDDSPWYPTMRLFRQQARGDWNGVFAQMAATLAPLAAKGHTK